MTSEELDALHARDVLLERIAKDLESARRSMKVAVVLCIAMVVFGITLSVVFSRVVSNGRDIQAGCKAANEARAVELGLWLYILDLPPITPRTAAQDQQASDFRKELLSRLSPRDCSTNEPVSIIPTTAVPTTL